MTTTTPKLEIRERRPDEVALNVRINNAAMPDDQSITEEMARIQEDLDRPEEPALRLVGSVDGLPVAAGYSGRNIFNAAGRYTVDVQVIPEFRRRGIASSLYGRLVSFAIERGASNLVAHLHADCLATASSWLEREGYVEIERMRPSDLALDDIDFEAWRPAEDRVEGEGIVLTTLADDDTEATRRRLWKLSERVRADVPHQLENREEFPFERFSELLDRPEARPGCLVIASDGDRFVGLTLLVHQGPDRALTGLTGVDREYRGHGIALALKVRCARLAREAGYRVMRTYNHVNNPAMLAVNDKLGYRELPHSILFQKVLVTKSGEGQA